MEALEQQLGDLRATLAHASRGIRKARADQRRAQLALARQWQVSTEERRTAVIIYVLAGHTAQPAAKYLAARGRIRHWPDRSERELCSLVDSLFVEEYTADADGLIALCDEGSPSDPAAMAAAAGYVEEWRLFAWAKELNVSKGVAPSTSAVLEHVVATRVASGHAAPHALGTVARGASRMWATRWRRRWNGRYGGIREHDQVPLDELVAKALRFLPPSHLK